jgi:hypothetical protein
MALTPHDHDSQAEASRHLEPCHAPLAQTPAPEYQGVVMSLERFGLRWSPCLRADADSANLAVQRLGEFASPCHSVLTGLREAEVGQRSPS